MADRVRVETSHRIRAGYEGGWQPGGLWEGRVTGGQEGGSGEPAKMSGAS